MSEYEDRKRQDALFRAGLGLLGGTAALGALMAGRAGVGTGMALLVPLLAFAPADRIRHHLSFAGHRLPAMAVFLFGLAVALAALAAVILR